MNVKAIRTGVLIASSLVTLAVLAQEAPGVAPTAAAVVAPTIHIPEGTEVPLLFVDPVSSATNAEGDRFTLRVDGDVKIGGRVAIKSGSIAVGTVTNAHKRGFMGKAGESKVGTTVALTILFGPVGLLKRGHDIDIKPGTPITAFVDQATDIVVPL